MSPTLVYLNMVPSFLVWKSLRCHVTVEPKIGRTHDLRTLQRALSSLMALIYHPDVSAMIGVFPLWGRYRGCNC